MEKPIKVRLSVLAALLAVSMFLFPVRQTSRTAFVAPDGTKIGSVETEVLRPWWYPKSALTREAPLAEATPEQRKQLADEARRSGNTAALAALEGDAATPGGSSSGGEPGSSGSSTSTGTTEPGSSTGSGATIESRIPARVTGYRLESEQRAILSWYGMFKQDPKTDARVVFASVAIEQIGRNRAEAAVDEFRRRFGAAVKSVRVEGLQAYEAAVGSQDVELLFVDGDFLYTVRVNVTDAANAYLDEAVRIAEEAYI